MSLSNISICSQVTSSSFFQPSHFTITMYVPSITCIASNFSTNIWHALRYSEAHISSFHRTAYFGSLWLAIMCCVETVLYCVFCKVVITSTLSDLASTMCISPIHPDERLCWQGPVPCRVSSQFTLHENLWAPYLVAHCEILCHDSVSTVVLGHLSMQPSQRSL